ncbi:MAG: hypothetical protein ACKVQK_05440 [Burkholderiales bacterium]
MIRNMGEWARDTPWHQGNVLPDDACKALGLSHAESAERIFVVVVSHDCDLAQDPGKEPFVEIVTGRIIGAIKAYGHAKSARRLHIEYSGQQGPLAVELSAVDKVFVKKNDLAPFDPRTDVNLDAQGLAILQRWLAARYRRAAFPDEFERRLKETKVPRRIKRALDTAGKHVVAIFFDVDGGEDIQHHGAADFYCLGIQLLYDTGMNESDAEAAARRAANEIEKAFESAFQGKDQAWKSIRLEYCDVISDQAMSYRDSRLFKQWRLEYISLEDDPQQPVLEE